MRFDEQTFQQIDDYLNDRLSEAARQTLEEQIREQPTLAEEVDIHRNLMDILGEQTGKSGSIDASQPAVQEVVAALTSEESFRIRTAIDQVNERYQQNNTNNEGKRQFPLLAIAATIALVITVSVVFWQQFSEPGLYEQYKDTYSPIALVERSASAGATADLISAFGREDYQTVISIATSSTTLIEEQPAVLLYLGIAYREEAMYPQAVETFSRYGEVNDLDQSMAAWNLGLVYLKTEEYEKAKLSFVTAAEDTGFQGSAAAKEILKKLE